MLNLDKYISDFLLANKSLSAQGLGEFVIVNGQAPNGAPLTEFTYNKQALTTEALITYVAEQEHKNKVVTGFDLEAHFNEARQFINIGTPWIIPGIGQLQLGKNRELEFIQKTPDENIIHERIKRKQAAAAATHHQPHTYEPSTVAASSEAKSNTGTIILTLFIILALGAGGYYFYVNKGDASQAAANEADTTATLTDTIVNVPPSSNMNNTVTATQPPANNNAATPTTPAAAGGALQVKFILDRTVNPAYARKRYNQLKSYGTPVLLDSVKKDSYTLYKVFLQQAVQTTDTTRIKDSLARYYGKPVRIEKGQ